MALKDDFILSELTQRLAATEEFTEYAETIYHFVYERLADIERELIIKTIADFFHLKSDIKFRKPITGELIEEYFVARSFGLSVTDAAWRIGITKTRLLYALVGIGIPIDLHQKLLEGELAATGAAQYVAAKEIFVGIKEPGGWRAAIAFLERRYASQWGKQQDTKIINNITQTNTDIENTSESKALSAIKTLQEIRKNKRAAQNNAQAGDGNG